MLTYVNLKTDLYNMVGAKSTTSRSDITTAVSSAIRRATEEFVHFGDWSFLQKFSDRVYIPLAAPYETGTVTVTQDSKTITGSGSTWTKDMEGSFFQITSGEFYEIRTFTSTTSMELTIPYQGSTASAQTYKIGKRFYPLPLNFSRPWAKAAKIATPGSNSETALAYSHHASFADLIQFGKPSWFGLVGNTRTGDYHNTSTVTVASSGAVSTWTFASATLPTDIVDREIRIAGESRSYYIKTRSSSSAAITYDTYVNPSDATNTQATASNYAITPKDTQLIGFSYVPDQRYIFWMPYVTRLPDMILDADISPIVYAGYEDALVSLCRKILAQDGRVAMRGDQVQNLKDAANEALNLAWDDELRSSNMKEQAGGYRPPEIQPGPAWL